MSTEKVNDARTSFRHYRGSNGAHISMPDLLQVPESTYWSRFKERWFKWEYNLIVAGKTIEKGWVVPQPLGIALLLVILGGVGTLYWRIVDKQNAQDAAVTEKLQSQRDLLIEVRTKLQDKAETDKEWQRRNENNNELQDMKIQDLKDKLLVLNTKKGK